MVPSVVRLGSHGVSEAGSAAASAQRTRLLSTPIHKKRAADPRHNRREPVLRSLANSALSLVVVATFLWGGCVSCEQFFMFSDTKQQCCNKAGQCERPGKNSPKPEKQDCNRLPLDRGENPHFTPPPALTPAVIGTDIVHVALPALFRMTVFELPPGSSPPDRQALNATFLI